MGPVDLYNGENRTAYWWKMTMINSVITPLFIIALAFAIPRLYILAGGSELSAWMVSVDNFIFDFHEFGAVFFSTCAILIGVFVLWALLCPNLSFSFYYWNLPLFFIVWPVVSGIHVLFKLSNGWNIDMGTGLEYFHVFVTLPVFVWFLIVIVKTLVLYKRFRLVAEERY